MLNTNKHYYTTTVANDTASTGPTPTGKDGIYWSQGEMPPYSVENFDTSEELQQRMIEIAPENEWQIVI